MNYLVAFDKFKGAITAEEAVALASDTISESQPEALILKAPLTDGGEGFATLLGSALGGEIHSVEVPGPRFLPVSANFSMVDGENIPSAAWDIRGFPESLRSGKIAFIEMASASGYECLEDDQRDPWKTTTIGTGMLMQKAVEAGAGGLILGIGGSATNDCGAGALEALGVCYYDRELQAVSNIIPERFREVNTLGSTSHMLDAFPPVRIACDVVNPLLGPDGASRIFGPQKGLKDEDFDRMERNIWKMGTRILGLFGLAPTDWDQHLNEPGSGAAGGIGFALRHALPDSSFVEGFPLVSSLLDLPGKIAQADCIITGEGRLDVSSLSGKGPVGLIRMASPSSNILFLAGSIDSAAADKLKESHPNLTTRALSVPSWTLEEALQKTPETLVAAIRESILPDT